MKHLILIRHAKSLHGIGMRDFDRPLADSGFIDAALVSREASGMFANGSAVWSSPAKRTRDTSSIFAASYPAIFSQTDFISDLYTFNLSGLEDEIRSCDDSIDNLIVFGHNEAITDFVNKFGNVMIDNVPTCGLVPITFDTDSWKSITRGKTGKCIFPKDLRT